MHKCACVCVEVGWRRRIRAVVFLWLRLRLSLWVRPFQLTNTTTVNSCTVAGLCSSFFVFLFIFSVSKLQQEQKQQSRKPEGVDLNLIEASQLIAFAFYSSHIHFSAAISFRKIWKDFWRAIVIQQFLFFCLAFSLWHTAKPKTNWRPALLPSSPSLTECHAIGGISA